MTKFVKQLSDSTTFETPTSKTKYVNDRWLIIHASILLRIINWDVTFHRAKWKKERKIATTIKQKKTIVNTP